VEIREDEKVIWQQDIEAITSPYQGAGIYQFPTIEPHGEKEHAIVIRKINGDPQHNLSFLIYDMYGYNPYPAGKAESQNLINRDGALMFSLSYEYDGTYMSKGTYWMLLILAEILPLWGLVYSLHMYLKTKREKN
jgi:hypothetical protein